MTAPLIVELTDPEATDPELVGAKAASLARALRAGLPVLSGWVVTVPGVRAINDQGGCRAVSDVLRSRYEHDAGTPLVVRSSSTVEDRENSSMAGQFTSVLDVREWDAFGDAVCTVIASARTVEAMNAPIAVLVQPLLEPAAGGVMFGIDPVTGRKDRRVVAAVPGGPDKLVSGEVDGALYVLTPRGRGPSRRTIPSRSCARRICARSHACRRRSSASSARRRTSSGRSTRRVGSCCCRAGP